MDDDEYGRDGDGWYVVRSAIHRGTWHPIPIGISVDQTYASACGPLHLAKAWVTDYWVQVPGTRWKRVDADTYLLICADGTPAV